MVTDRSASQRENALRPISFTPGRISARVSAAHWAKAPSPTRTVPPGMTTVFSAVHW